MKKYRVTLTRLIEEECCIYVDADDEASANWKALEALDNVAEMIWERTAEEPHTYSVEKVQLADRSE